MKVENIKSLTIGVLLFIVFLQYKSCNGKQTTIIKEEKGSIEAVKPEVITQIKVVEKGNIIPDNRLIKEYNYTKQEVEKLVNEIAQIEAIADSLAYKENEAKELLKEYAKINEFKADLSDDKIQINVNGVTFKNIAERVKIDYTIKERNIIYKGLFIGGEFGTNKDLNQFTYKINADYLYNKKIYKGSYQRINNDNFILIGGSIKVF
jgi:hypothetical protein